MVKAQGCQAHSRDVTIVIPSYNAGRYLDQALASVAGQTQRPAAVVIADDCSTDDTLERARQWQDRFPLHVVPAMQRTGPGPARHRAILASDTPLIATLDADDVLLPDHMESALAMYNLAPGLVSPSGLLWIPVHGINLSPYPPVKLPDPGQQLVTLLRGNYIPGCGSLFSRELYERVGGYRGRFHESEDWDLWIRMVRAGATVTRPAYPTFLIRKYPTSFSANAERLIDCDIEVLSTAVLESRSVEEREAARLGLQVARARRRYYRARALAAAGHPWRARREALRGPVGRWKVTLGLVTMAMSPLIARRFEHAGQRDGSFLSPVRG
jgi:glycosyltransferase involved in cell wall biosynthesis